MYQLENHTNWSAGLYPGWSLNRQLQQTLVFKVGFGFDPAGKLSPLPRLPIEEADSYTGDPKTSSLTTANEIAPFKKGGEILLFGNAHPKHPGESVFQVTVGLRQRNDQFWKKELRVFGPRVWQRKMLLAVPGLPGAIKEPVPMVYENAYGGCDPASSTKTFLANPAGKGYSLRGLRTRGLTLPRVECGPPFIESPASRVSPAGFGPIPSHWEPRSKETVEIDKEALAGGGCPWAKEAPESLYNTAPLDQRFDQPFEGEMTLSLKGLVADAPGEVLINLPEIKPRVQLEQEETVSDQWALCDTIIVQADRMEIHQIFRCAFPWVPKNSFQGVVILRDLVAEAEKEREKTEEVS